MTRFLDGPAEGKSAMLKRSPIYLRVVIDQQGNVDALDQVLDTPHFAERLYAYRLHGERGTVHLNMGRGRGGFYALAEYKLLPDQPSDAIMRKLCEWQSWVVKHHAQEST